MKKDKDDRILEEGKIAFMKMLFLLNAPWNVIKGLRTYKPLRRFLIPPIMEALRFRRKDWKTIKNLLEEANKKAEGRNEYSEQIKIWLSFIEDEDKWR